MKKIWVLFLCALVFSSNVFAQSNVTEELGNKSALAKQSDLLGQWEMIYQTVDPQIKNESPFFYDDQTWIFFEDGYVKNVASNKLMSEDDRALYFNTMPKTTKFSFLKDGLLEIVRNPKDVDIIYISIVTSNMEQSLRPGAPLLERGDLVLSYMHPSKKSSYMQRFLRRTEISSVE